jgi:hypothetical protein
MLRIPARCEKSDPCELQSVNHACLSLRSGHVSARHRQFGGYLHVIFLVLVCCHLGRSSPDLSIPPTLHNAWLLALQRDFDYLNSSADSRQRSDVTGSSRTLDRSLLVKLMGAAP